MNCDECVKLSDEFDRRMRAYAGARAALVSPDNPDDANRRRQRRIISEATRIYCELALVELDKHRRTHL
jgi:hypothetical protein